MEKYHTQLRVMGKWWDWQFLSTPYFTRSPSLGSPVLLGEQKEGERIRPLHPLNPCHLHSTHVLYPQCAHRHCSHEIRGIIPVPQRRARTTRSSTHSHPFQVLLHNPQILSHKSSFIPRTCNLWNILPSSCFPESYKLPSLKSNTNKLDLISFSS